MFQQRCIVFAGRRGLDQIELRHSVARIPEVSRKLKIAQFLVDQAQGANSKVDLFSSLHSTDGDFASQQDLRALLSAIVQVGLYERYVRFYGQPHFLVGTTNGVSSLSVAKGDQSFEEMVIGSQYFQALLENNGEESEVNAPRLTLTGLSLEEFGVVANKESKFENLDWQTQDCYQILCQLHQDHQVEQFVHVGPSFEFRDREMAKRKIFEFLLGNSVELDPILNSFWRTA